MHPREAFELPTAINFLRSPVSRKFPDIKHVCNVSGIGWVQRLSGGACRRIVPHRPTDMALGADEAGGGQKGQQAHGDHVRPHSR